MKIDKKELQKPIVKKADGTFATLKEVIEKTLVVPATLSSKEYKDLALVRFETMDPKKVFSVIGIGTFTKDQILTEIRRDTDIGKKFVKMQERFVRYILNRKEEIDVN